jgi:DNA-binding response OmpR family regulator
MVQAGVARPVVASSHRLLDPKDALLPRVLVVDDDPMVSMAIEVCLKRQGMLVDIFMPHMRGFESIRIFHERAPTIPLIAMSGYAFAGADTASPDFLRMTLELGATRCLRKPFTPQALLAAINDCLEKQMVNHLQQNQQ